jgi:serine/threonine protein kinase
MNDSLQQQQQRQQSSNGVTISTERECDTPPPREFNAFHGLCRSVHDFEKIVQIGQGTYGVVFKAKDLHTGRIYALKQVKMNTSESKDGMPITAMREIQLLTLLKHHENIVFLEQVVVGDKLDSIFLVFEYCEHDMSMLLEKRPHCFSESEIKCLMLQLLRGVHYMHKNFVIHRDIKMSNLLYNSKGQLKIADFGLAKHYGRNFDVERDSIEEIERKEEPLTQKVVTLWYRAPELLLGSKEYSTSVDMWAVGCIFAEFVLSKPLFPGKVDTMQLKMIYELLSEPNEIIWPGFESLPNASLLKRQQSTIKGIKDYENAVFERLKSKFRNCKISHSGLRLLQRMLTYDPKKRITASEALNHEYFQTSPYPQTVFAMPTFPAST